MSILETRHHQIFPVLDAVQVETAKRFASSDARHFAPDELIYDVGERSATAWLVLDGSMRVVQRAGLAKETLITEHLAGQFSGEVSQLAGRPSLAAARAGANGCKIGRAHV